MSSAVYSLEGCLEKIHSPKSKRKKFLIDLRPIFIVPRATPTSGNYAWSAVAAERSFIVPAQMSQCTFIVATPTTATNERELRELWPAIDYNTPSRKLLAGFELYGIDTACIAYSNRASPAVGARCALWKLQNCVVPSDSSLACRCPFSPGGST